jgi:hypothetical protein
VWRVVSELGLKFSGDRTTTAMSAGQWAQQWLEHAKLWVHNIRAALEAGAPLPELEGRLLVSTAANSLQGAAATWFRQQRASVWAGAVPAWGDFVSALQQEFPEAHDLLKQQTVKSLRQTGTLSAYLDYAKKVDGQTPSVSQLLKVECFLTGLSDSSLRERGFRQYVTNPRWCLRDAVQWVRVEADVAALAAQRQQQRSGRSHGGAVNALLGQQPGNAEYSGCYACGSSEHRVKDCTDAAKKEQWLAKRKKQQHKQRQGEGSRPRAGGNS